VPWYIDHTTSFKHFVEHRESTSLKELITRINDSVQIHPLARPIFFNWTNITYADIIRVCNNTAIIGWTSDLLKIQKPLKGIQNVFLGEEIIGQKNFGLNFEYWNDPRVLDRLRCIRDSGISDEWVNITYRKVPQNPVPPQKANMQGHIVVQFLLLVVGLSLALLGFMIEKRKSFLNGWNAVLTVVILLFNSCTRFLYKLYFSHFGARGVWNRLMFAHNSRIYVFT